MREGFRVTLGAFALLPLVWIFQPSGELHDRAARHLTLKMPAGRDVAFIPFARISRSRRLASRRMPFVVISPPSVSLTWVRCFSNSSTGMEAAFWKREDWLRDMPSGKTVTS